MQQFTKIFKAMADPSRIKILKSLEERPLCVCELKELLGLAQPTISKHLKILQEAGLVNSQRHKNWTQYHVTDGGDSIYAKTLLSELRGWLDGDQEIISIKKRLRSINCKSTCT